MSPITSGRKVDRTLALIRSTASSPAAMSTPASLYVSPVSPVTRAVSSGGAAGVVGGEQRRLVEHGLGRDRGASLDPVGGSRLEHALVELDGDLDRVDAGE